MPRKASSDAYFVGVSRRTHTAGKSGTGSGTVYRAQQQAYAVTLYYMYRAVNMRGEVGFRGA